MSKFKRLLTIFVLSVFVFGHAVPVNLAIAAPEAPSAPSAPAPEAPSAPSAPTPEAPKAPEAPKVGENKEPEKTPEPSKTPSASATPAPTQQASSTPKPTATPAPSSSSSSSPASSSTPNPTATPLPSGNQTGTQSGSGQNGNTEVKTGDATNNAGVVNNGNMNAATSGSTPTNGTGTGTVNSGPSLGVANTGNGAGSNNNGSLSVGNATTTNQANSAQVANNVNQSTVTGQNDASKNTGGNTNLTTGDANTTGTIVNNLNTNASGIAVAEFNVEDDHVGDIVLDFTAGCISNCGTGSVNLANTGNGADSTNTTNLDSNNSHDTFQSNDADVENNMTLSADSGNNDASKNTGGDTSIKTGDANVSANVLTFANNNVAGNVVYTVVNIFGSLVGDIIMSPEYIAAAGGCMECGGGDTTLKNSGNGAGSDNTVNLEENNSDATFQTNEANIENNLIVDANTAGNSASGNTNGDNQIQTGDTNVDANIINVANNNVSGGVWWLVLINDGGRWIGKLVGSEDGANMAASEGTELRVDENGDVYATNSGNGADSANTTNASVNNSNTTVQNNNANIVNNVNLSGNTGGNTANKNTGGNTNIETGDVNVVANMVNFVNNNISSGGKLFVTVVNVLGDGWLGNFITPDATKEEIAAADVTPTIAKGAPEEEITEEVVEEQEETSDDSAATTTTKKTRKVVKKKAASTAVPAYTESGNGGTGSGGASATSILGQVAGVKIGPAFEAPEGAIVGSQKTKINLAWLVLALPLLGLLALSRIRVAYYTRRLKEKLGNSKVEGVVLGSLVTAFIFLLNRVS